ncbi:class A beta-lactamase (plasmid) [Gemmobacter fulvus]|uniref:Beta-lactamase n=1 Tax=Gemmobacter fulvus TaxID=2840474 RepID=A0A975PCF3_9RHOB|nr:class A beta-lactamase [Gemmobacter fulvus]MBT9246476.1 class A beta-lactamase [Gemmobacter fulvus]QWK92576.1 class A beta-lactamase [Gemmobacter fulvus]
MQILLSLPFMAALALALPLQAETVTEAAMAVEADLGGRVGTLLRAPGAAPLAAWQADDRFPLSSTFKAPLCGAVLARVDAGSEQMDRVIPYTAQDLVSHSPVTETRAGKGMRVADLCAATITLSDNTAANLLLDTVGGPEGFTGFLRSIGDMTTRLDRQETAPNEALPKDQRDTTTPRAMTDTLEALLFSGILSTESRTQLESWMQQDQVAGALIRASLPEGWTIADKTGAGGHGARSIVAVIRTPDGTPWLAAIYLADNSADMDSRNRAIARIGAAMVEEIRAN